MRNLILKLTYSIYHVESVRVQMNVHWGYFIFGKLIYIGKFQRSL